MEELRSTEVLDREILEDARKKAHKILTGTDDKVRSQTRRWERKTEKDIANLNALYGEREEKTQKEILARLPLDKRRLRSETTEAFLKNALGSFLNSLSREDILRILEEEFVRRLEDCKAEIAGLKTKSTLYYRAMTEAEAQNFVKKVVARPEIQDAARGLAGSEFRQDGDSDLFPVLVLDTPELRIIASVENAAEDLLKEKRAEVVGSLLGEGALYD